MGNDKKNEYKSRRWFLTGGLAEPGTSKETVKMLTADGKLVEVLKSVLEAAGSKQKVSNKEILEWMKNPSKDNS